ncbi:hypothetical protein [Sinosporangium siamense]|uniref:Uncharacterized protein n=1 Tax=Sinosporangium siamense TaxID=1367973 RepID=A0A919V9G6_9ACTN|nr:hypothetical protein [Sinosporangium siamense]GII95281.1 hypothetical protein Ssi02_55120 [Sinosporangium siamense]
MSEAVEDSPDYRCPRSTGGRCTCDGRPFYGHYDPEIERLAALGRLLGLWGLVFRLDRGDPFAGALGRSAAVCRPPVLRVWDRGGGHLADLRVEEQPPSWTVTLECRTGGITPRRTSLDDDAELGRLVSDLDEAATACLAAAQDDPEVCALVQRLPIRWERGRLPGHTHGIVGTVRVATVKTMTSRLSEEVTLVVHLPGPDGQWPEESYRSPEEAMERAVQAVTAFTGRLLHAPLSGPV